jgi:hypothetical protein
LRFKAFQYGRPNPRRTATRWLRALPIKDQLAQRT